MSEVFVLVDHANGEVRKATFEMLTIAARLGAPAAVFIGQGIELAKESLAKYGATRIYAVSAADFTDYLVAPQAEVLAGLVSKLKPAAVLIPSTATGKEIAARLAVKTDSGLITDAVDRFAP